MIRQLWKYCSSIKFGLIKGSTTAFVIGYVYWVIGGFLGFANEWNTWLPKPLSILFVSFIGGFGFVFIYLTLYGVWKVSPKILNLIGYYIEKDRELRRTKQYWLSLSPREFELELANLYKSKGYSVTVSRLGGDGGVDLVMRRDGKKYIVQCKAHIGLISPSVVRDLYGTMNHENADLAILASRSGFTAGSVSFAANKPIQLLGLEDIIKLVN